MKGGIIAQSLNKCGLSVNQVEKVIKVRYAVSDDRDFIVKANSSMALETENLVLDPDILKAGVSAVFEDSSRGRYIVAEFNGELCATLMVTIEWSDWRNLEIAWIQSLYVVEQERGNGIFKQMFTYLESLVAAGEYAGIRLYVDRTNSNAIEVYKKLDMNGDHYTMFEKMK